MEEDFAFNHSPNTPLWDTLGVYHKVNFENLEKWKYYYFKNGNYIEDYIVQVIRKSNLKVTFVTKYKRATSHWGVGPNAKYEGIDGQASEWKEVGYRAEITLKHNELDDQDANAGTRSLYVYDEDVVMQNGGLRRGGLVGKVMYGSYKDGSGIFKDTNGYYIIQLNPRTGAFYKKHLKSWKPSKGDTRECLINGRWKSCKTRKASKKSRTQTRRN